MNDKNLSKRLLALSHYVNQGQTIADIGTDHGHLPIYLVKSAISPAAIACDVNEKPLAVARKNISSHRLNSKIELRLGDGLTTLQPGEVQVVIIAGMGGNTIKQILSAAPTVTSALQRLILQPMGDEDILRYWLLTNGWQIIDETLVQEDDHLYVIIICEQGQEQLYPPVILEIGPRLIEKKHPLLPELMAKLQGKYQRILSGLVKSNRPENQLKLKQVKERLTLLEGAVKDCQ